jgi:hypothetical protein
LVRGSKNSTKYFGSEYESALNVETFSERFALAAIINRGRLYSRQNSVPVEFAWPLDSQIVAC